MNSVLALLLTFTITISGSGHETPQQIVTRYNNYKAICSGLGYQNVRCDTANKDTVAFQSSLTKTLQNLKTQETVIFDRVLLNEGNAYNKSTGKFTATVEGVYSFSWAILSHAGKYFISEIVHNGNPVVYNYCDGRGRKSGSGFVTTSNQANIKLKKGEEVWIRTHGNHGLYASAGNWCTFSGFKV